MGENLIFYGLIILAGVLVLMFIKPFREFVLAIAGASSFWGMVWGFFMSILKAHGEVLRNFAPRDVIYPSLKNKKATRLD